jgi:hypothetical protein
VRSVCPERSGPSCVKVAPQFAHNASVADVRALVADGTATLLLLSAEANDLNPSCQFSDDKFKNGQGCTMKFGPYPGGPRGGNHFTGPTEGMRYIHALQFLRVDWNSPMQHLSVLATQY